MPPPLDLGRVESRDELSRLRTTATTYEPSMSDSTRSSLHERWLQAVEHAKGWARDEEEGQ